MHTGHFLSVLWGIKARPVPVFSKVVVKRKLVGVARVNTEWRNNKMILYSSKQGC
jgi:hypothetical protein